MLMRGVPALLVISAFLLAPSLVLAVPASSINVTVSSSKSTIGIGETATLTVYGQVKSTYATTNNGIFGWDVDLHLADSSLIQLLSGTLSRTGWTNTPSTSSSGTALSWGLDAIYDTGESSSTLGLTSPVRLFSVNFTGLAQGSTNFSISADATSGTDFLTWNSNTGGDYSNASIPITVTPEPATLGLLLLGGAAALARRSRRRKS
jgi:hypothetical protein